MSISATITIVILSFVVLGVLWGILWGMLRGALRSTTRLLTTILAAVIAVFVAKYLNETIIPSFEPMIIEFLQTGLDGEFGDIVSAADTLVVYLVEIVAALITPLLYSIVFLVCNIVLFLLYALIALFFPRRKKHPLKPASRWVGAVFSTAGALVVTISLLMPTVGYISIAADVYTAAREEGVVTEDLISSELDEQLADASDNGMVSFVNFMGGNFLFTTTSKTPNYDAKEELTNLVTSVSKVIPGILRIMEDNTLEEGAEVQPLNLSGLYDIVLPALEENEQLRTIFAEVFATAATKWKNNEAFLSINLNEILGDYAPAAETILDDLAGTNKDDIVEDIRHFGDCLTTLSNTYVYFVWISDETKDADDLSGKALDVFAGMSEKTAQVISNALTSDVITGSNLAEENTSTILTLLSETLLEIASSPEAEDGEKDEKEAAALAINQMVSYASDIQRSDKHEEELIDALLDSSILSNRVIEISTDNEAAAETGGSKNLVLVSSSQKIKLEDKVALKIADFESDLSISAKEQEQIDVLNALLSLLTTSAESGQNA